MYGCNRTMSHPIPLILNALAESFDQVIDEGVSSRADIFPTHYVSLLSTSRTHTAIK